jgi:glutathione S-transferase
MQSLSIWHANTTEPSGCRQDLPISGEVARGPWAARLVTVWNENLGGEEETIRRSHSLLRLLDQHLQSLDWLALGRPTLADVAIYTYVAHAPEGNVDLSGYQNVNNWLKRVEDLLGFIPLMQRRRDFAQSSIPLSLRFVG